MTKESNLRNATVLGGKVIKSFLGCKKAFINKRKNFALKHSKMENMKYFNNLAPNRENLHLKGCWMKIFNKCIFYPWLQ